MVEWAHQRLTNEFAPGVDHIEACRPIDLMFIRGRRWLADVWMKIICDFALKLRCTRMWVIRQMVSWLSILEKKQNCGLH